MLLWKHIENFENILWDWNGTLLDDNVAAWNAEAKIFEHLGLPHMDMRERKKHFTMPVRLYYEKIGFDFSRMDYEKLSAQWFGHYENELQSVDLFHGTRELLERVVSAGKKQFILSAAPQSHLEKHTLSMDIRRFFDGIYGLQTQAADCKRQRGRDLFEDHKLDPQKTLIIGDMVHDAEVADVLGCSVLLVADGHQDVSVLREVIAAQSMFLLESRYSDSNMANSL